MLFLQTRAHFYVKHQSIRHPSHCSGSEAGMRTNLHSSVQLWVKGMLCEVTRRRAHPYNPEVSDDGARTLARLGMLDELFKCSMQRHYRRTIDCYDDCVRAASSRVPVMSRISSRVSRRNKSYTLTRSNTEQRYR